MKIKAPLSVLAAVLCACLLLTGCNLFQNSNDDTQQNQAADQQVNTAQVIVESALLFDEPAGSEVGQLAQGTTVTFTETVDTGSEIWVRCESPVADTWVLLSDLQVTAGNSMSVVYGPDGSVSGGTIQMVVGPNGEMTIVSPDGSNGGISNVPVTPSGNTAVPVTPSGSDVPYSELAGVWQCQIGDTDFQSGSGVTLTLGANGYCVMERGVGEYIADNQFLLNYTDERLFGTYAVVDGVFTFTVTEDWYYNHGQNIGKVFTYEYVWVKESFYLDEMLFYPSDEQFGWMDEVNGVQNGVSGNDLTDPDYREPVITSGPEELLGTWVCFEERQTTYLRRMWVFEDGGNCGYKEHIFEQVGADWVTLPISEYVDIVYDGYYFADGKMYVGIGPDSFGPYDVTINGDTMTISGTDWYGVTETVTYTRTTDSDPAPR